MKSKELFPPAFSRHGFMSWVDSASRIEGIDEIRRQAMMDEAVVTLRQDHPGRIVTKGRNHVLLASA